MPQARMKHPPATPAEIAKILGPIDDEVIAEIANTGATADEVCRARNRLDEDGPGMKPQTDLAVHARRVYDILQREQEAGIRD